MTGDEPEGFLGRWSRVKRTAACSVPELEPEPAPEPETSGGADADPAAGTGQAPDAAQSTSSAEELAALPRIEDLVPGSDIRAFLRTGVPRALRNAAMRRMWMLTPGIRDYKDPAVDYAWDWNTPGGVPGDGVAPTPERAAQMLKSFLAPRPQTTPDEAMGEGGDAPSELADHAAPETADDTPDSPSSLVEDAAAGGDRMAVADAQEAPEADLDPVPRRRHGSALPG